MKRPLQEIPNAFQAKRIDAVSPRLTLAPAIDLTM